MNIISKGHIYVDSSAMTPDENLGQGCTRFVATAGNMDCLQFEAGMDGAAFFSVALPSNAVPGSTINATIYGAKSGEGNPVPTGSAHVFVSARAINPPGQFTSAANATPAEAFVPMNGNYLREAFTAPVTATIDGTAQAGNALTFYVGRIAQDDTLEDAVLVTGVLLEFDVTL